MRVCIFNKCALQSNLLQMESSQGSYWVMVFNVTSCIYNLLIFYVCLFYRKSLTLVTITATTFYVHADNNYYSRTHANAHAHTDTHAHWSMLLCRTQWPRGRASDSRLREPGFESCATVFKTWAIVSLYIAPVHSVVEMST